MEFKKVGLACDHAGKELKQLVYEFLQVSEVEVVDFGVALDTDKSVDYPDYASSVASEVSKTNLDGGILICGTGIGMSMAANKFTGVRAALVWDEFTARMCREHNNANILCLGSRVVNHHRSIEIVKIWLQTAFGGERHQLRLDKIANIEKQNFLGT